MCVWKVEFANLRCDLQTLLSFEIEQIPTFPHFVAVCNLALVAQKNALRPEKCSLEMSVGFVSNESAKAALNGWVFQEKKSRPTYIAAVTCHMLVSFITDHFLCVKKSYVDVQGSSKRMAGGSDRFDRTP